MKASTMETAAATVPVAEFLFEEVVYLTGVTEYGVSWEALNRGDVMPPPEGARFDIAFRGTLDGPRLRGGIEGVDYLTVRADGRFMLRIQATITTDDGARIALTEEGILSPVAGGPAQLRLSMRFTTHHPRYAWLNACEAWAAGAVDQQRGEVTVKAWRA